MTDFCMVCGSKDKITTHHLKDIHGKHNKKGKAKVNGYLYVCRRCHDIIEDIVNKGKSKKLWFKKGYQEGLKSSENLLLCRI